MAVRELDAGRFRSAAEASRAAVRFRISGPRHFHGLVRPENEIPGREPKAARGFSLFICIACSA